MIEMKEVDNFVHLHPDIMLLKEPRFYCFLLRWKRDEAEPFMQWVVETVLPWAVRKLTSVIKEKDATIAHRDNQIQAIKYESVVLQA